MQVQNTIEVKHVTKSFKVYFDKGSQLKEKILFRKRSRFEERRVLDDISFSVKQGEAIGLIGNNGCGKSTTLKLLTKIIYPDSGSIEMGGRVSSLIELGAGFHPDMSGRENIYINAAIFGLTRKEIDERLESIIGFSELEEYIDNPVRTYSSGMYMRLAFSVAINVDADILLIDEILAVGDARFQAKCFNRLREIKAKGTTIVIVSHSTAQIEQICDRAIWIKDGKIEENGVPGEVIQKYIAWIMGGDVEGDNTVVLEQKEYPDANTSEQDSGENSEGPESATDDGVEISDEEGSMNPRSRENIHESGNWEVTIKSYSLVDGNTGKPKDRFSIGESMKIIIDYQRNNPDVTQMMCSLTIYRSDGILCYTSNSLIDCGRNINVKDEGTVEIGIAPMQLMQGEYSVDISLMVDHGPIYHQIVNAMKFTVHNHRTDYGVFRPQIEWRF